MINLDLDAMLSNNMTKTTILNQISTEIDKAIAKRIEREAASLAYKKAKENVANDTYTTDDLIILQRALNDKNRNRENSPTPTLTPTPGPLHAARALGNPRVPVSTTPFWSSDTATENQVAPAPTTPFPTKPKVMSVEELMDVIGALVVDDEKR